MTVDHDFGPADDGLHAPGDSHYETETFWYSFFVPERRIGGWVYAAVRQNAGVTAGGMWLWNGESPHAFDAPFFENFTYLKLPIDRGPEQVALPTGLRIAVRDPLTSYDLVYDDRARVDARLRFEALEPPVPLRTGEPPYPKAHHFDQTGHVTGTINLDGEPIAVDSYAMRDRSWGPRTERGYRRVGYTWAASPETSLLTYTAPVGAGTEHVYAGYLRRDAAVARIADGERVVERDPVEGWVTGIFLTATTESGVRVTGRAEALSRLILQLSGHLCICTLVAWDVDGERMYGEDQDVWPIDEWRLLRAAGRG